MMFDRDVVGWSLVIGLSVFFYIRMYGMLKFLSDKYHIITAFSAATLPLSQYTVLKAGLDAYAEGSNVEESVETMRAKFYEIKNAQSNRCQSSEVVSQGVPEPIAPRSSQVVTDIRTARNRPSTGDEGVGETDK